MARVTVAIIGGGISGLSTALALQKKGIEVHIFEKNHTYDGPDTGIILSGNAIRALDTIGLGAELRAKGITADACTVKSDSGTPIVKFDYQAPSQIPNYLFIERSVLHNMLENALDKGTLHTGKHLEEFTQSKERVNLTFKDGSMIDADYVIASDGGLSPIRTNLLPESTLSYSGCACWRGYIDQPDIKIDSYTETWGPRGRFGITQLPGDRLYWYAFKKREHGDQDMSQWAPIDLLFNFFYYHDPIQEILEKTPPENIIYDDLYILKPLERFQYDNILLMGDSAHLSMPNIGQGASQAIEDAVCLAKWVTNEKSIHEAFVLYDQHRIDRIKKVADEMKIYGRAAQVDFPVLCSLRNKILQLTPSSFHSKKLKAVVEIEDQI